MSGPMAGEPTTGAGPTGTADVLWLASRSPRRRQLLEQIGVAHRACPVDIDERCHAGEEAEPYARRMAREKAAGARERAHAVRDGACAAVLGADTVVVVDGEILGKPRDAGEAERMLARLSGRSHEVLSAVCLLARREGERASLTRVWLRPIGAAERAAYCATGEPLDKAGGYGIQGRAAAFVRRIDGSYSGVMGLPLFETCELLAAAGMPVLAPAATAAGSVTPSP